MKKFISTSLFACSSLIALAQSTSLSEGGCGTVTTPQEIQEVYDFVKLPLSARKTTGSDTIPLTIHIVGDDNGKGYYKLDNLFKVICELNDHYAPTGFYFNVKFPIRFINNSSYYNHDYSSGFTMMTLNNVNNTVNMYFVQDPGGNCGYYSPTGGAVAIGINCGAPGNSTVAHELGHYFGLPHTFYGWEGRTSANPPTNPEFVTRGAGANCSTAGDGFCDTDADYLSGRWNCPYSGTYADANGDAYKPDGTNYMSYSNDACTNHFSPMQMARMQNTLATKYSRTPTTGGATYMQLIAPALVYPTDKIYSNLTKVIWRKVNGAEAYQVSVVQGLTNRIETVTTDTSLDISSLRFIENNNYSITVTPLSGVNVCKTSSTAKSASYTSELTTLSVNDVNNSNNLTIHPNPANSALTVSMKDLGAGRYTLTMVGMNGQTVSNQEISNSGTGTLVTIPVATLPAGMYFIRLVGVGYSTVQKIMVQH
ncbi:MAG: T9SS type A sorting domain-containing protein [Sphingobacteriales bacterium]|nr:MAG: T9SS type A sorting domain-containing protein [Sphingobacteriales bacterium]